MVTADPDISWSGPPPAPKEPSRLWAHWTVLVVAVALFVGSVAATWWVRRVPVEESAGGYEATLEPLDPKDTSWSEASIWFEKPRGDVEVLSIEPRTSPNVEFLGAYAIWPSEAFRYVYTGGAGYPLGDQRRATRHPYDERIPVEEFRKVADVRHRFASLTVGMRIASGDVGILDGILVTYRIGEDKKKVFFRHSILGCVKPHPCEAPRDSDGRDFADQIRHRYGFVA